MFSQNRHKVPIYIFCFCLLIMSYSYSYDKFLDDFNNLDTYDIMDLQNDLALVEEKEQNKKETNNIKRSILTVICVIIGCFLSSELLTRLIFRNRKKMKSHNHGSHHNRISYIEPLVDKRSLIRR